MLFNAVHQRFKFGGTFLSVLSVLSNVTEHASVKHSYNQQPLKFSSHWTTSLHIMMLLFWWLIRWLIQNTEPLMVPWQSYEGSTLGCNLAMKSKFLSWLMSPSHQMCWAQACTFVACSCGFAAVLDFQSFIRSFFYLSMAVSLMVCFKLHQLCFGLVEVWIEVWMFKIHQEIYGQAWKGL